MSKKPKLHDNNDEFVDSEKNNTAAAASDADGICTTTT